MSIVFVVLTPNRIDRDIPLSRSEYETNYSLHPLIRIRKCVLRDDSGGCCMIFVDENARVYHHWQDYITENQLPAGVMVVPKNGVYTLDRANRVELDCVESPACSISNTVLKVTDIGTSVVGLGAAAIPAVALFAPIAAPVMAGAVVAAIGTGIYSIGRSAFNLIDRGSHEQSINVTDRQARGSWIGVVGGTVALGAGAAMKVVGKYAAAGNEVSAIVQTAVNGVNITSIVISGFGVGNGVLDIFLKVRDDEDISALDVVQLSASLVLFTHSVYNFQMASKIVENAQTGTIRDFKNGLSNRQRKMFIKMEKETIRIRGDTQGKMDIIRSLKKIPDTQYFNDIYKINKKLNENNIRPAFGGDGNVVLNNDISVDTGTLRQNVQYDVKGENILKMVNAPIPATAIEPKTVLSTAPNLPFNQKVALQVAQIVINSAKNLVVFNEAHLTNAVSHIFENLAFEAANYLIELARCFLYEFGKEIETTLRRVLPFEEVLWDLFQISKKIKDTVRMIDVLYLRTNARTLLNKLKEFYAKSVQNISGESIKCKKCHGYYSITTIN